MCGIVAFHSTAGPVAPAALDRATDALAYRGPDGRGTWVSPDGRTGLGHTRLSLIDPLADQPMASADSDLRLIVNGEFYDYEAIRRELLERGHHLRTRSDSEIALHLYEEQGVDCLASLRGEFAFVIWDEARRTLFAARDRFGIKPLFYAQVGPVLYLASEVKALLAAGVPAAWDDEAVYDALHLCFDARRTLHSEIRQLPPAHVLIATDRGVRIERYWDVPYPTAGERAANGTDAEHVERVGELLDAAVRLRLQSDGPVGCLLSGGVDSSMVLAMAARHVNRPIAAFTIGFNQAAYDETEAARLTAEHVGAAFHVLPVSDQDLADGFGEAVRHGEMLQLNAHGTARFLLSREIRRSGYKAVMAGEGGDELFMGYAFLQAALNRGGSQARGLRALQLAMRLLRPPTAAQRRLALTSPWLARLVQAMGFQGPSLDSLGDRLALLQSVLAPDFVAARAGHDPFRAAYESLDQRASLRRWEPAKALLYVWLRTIFASYHMAADRLDMAHAVEVRLPYLDHVLFEYVARIPVDRLTKTGQNKWLLRAVAGPYLPDTVRARVKQPFLAPPAAATPGNPLHVFVQDTLRSSSLGFVDRRKVVELLDSLPGRAPSELPALEGLLMALCSLTILGEQTFGDPTATVVPAQAGLAATA